jgi:hypothetical protein
LVVLGWIFFRAESMGQALAYIEKIAQFDTVRHFYRIFDYKKTYFFLLTMLTIEWFGRKNQFALEKWGLTWKKPIRYIFYFIIGILIICFSCREKTLEFIYFQF